MLTNEIKILDGPLSCLAANKHINHLAVGGRNVFKILSCKNQCFEEKCNFRFGVSANYLYLSVNDIAWSHNEENVLVAASNHGALVIWDIANYNQPKQDYVMKELRRSVNCLQFYPDSASNLLVASQDGACRCFDLREQGFVLCYGPSVECAARDVQFNPRNNNQFAVVFEDGSCELWDLRNTHRYERQWIAHRGPCVCMDWHPKNNWLVTGGRDKIAVVWDFSTVGTSGTSPTSVYSAETVASVGRVKWRPQYDFSILTTSMLPAETNVNIWDVRRPFVPEAYFVEHRDNIAGVLWSDDNTFYTCGRDSKLCRFVFSKRSHLNALLNPVAIDINNDGLIITSIHDQLINKTHTNFGMAMRLRSIPTLHQTDLEMVDNSTERRTDNLSNIDRKADYFSSLESQIGKLTTQHSSLLLFNPLDEFLLSSKSLRYMAENYKLEGGNLQSLCQHNAQVAAHFHHTQIASTWSMLRLMFESSDQQKKRPSKPDTRTNNLENSIKGEKNFLYALSNESNEDSESLDETSVSGNMLKLSSGITGYQLDESFKFENSSIFDDIPISNSPQEPSSIMLLNGDSDGGLIDADVDLNFFNHAQQQDLSTATIIFENDSQSYVESHLQMEEVIKKEILQCPKYVDGIVDFDYSSIILDVLNMYASQNDIQTAVSIGLVLDRSYIHRLPENIFDSWVDSYVDLLNELELYVVATWICKLWRADKPQISTVLKTCCSRCSRPLHPGGLCKRCPSTKSRSTYIHNCALCHKIVRGLFVWCQGCCHGGHIHHIKSWFESNIECPTGCGHYCQYV